MDAASQHFQFFQSQLSKTILVMQDDLSLSFECSVIYPRLSAIVVYKSPNENTFENYMSKFAVVVDRSVWIILI